MKLRLLMAVCCLSFVAGMVVGSVLGHYWLDLPYTVRAVIGG